MLIGEVQSLSREIRSRCESAQTEGQAYQLDTDKQQKLQSLEEHVIRVQGDDPLISSYVNADAIAQVIESWSGIPARHLMASETEQLLTLEDKLNQRVIGQAGAIGEIARSIRINRSGLGDIRRPVGVFLMCGPSGVGKSETGLALAEQLYGGEKNLTVINMTEFKEEHKVSMLLGAPAGYVGYGEGGVLTEAVRRNPHSVLLLDEMEKAHPGVQDVFYQIFDKGSIADSEGRVIDFHNTLIIMTSNAADSAITDFVETFEPFKAEHQQLPESAEIVMAIEGDLLKCFKPAFLGRVIVISYLPLNEHDMKQICQLSLARIRKNVSDRYQAEFIVDEKAIEQIVLWNQNPLTGARAIEQIINRRLLPEMARECLVRSSQGLPIKRITVAINQNNLDISIQ